MENLFTSVLILNTSCISLLPLLHFSFPCNRKILCCLYVTFFLINLLAGTDKNDSADKVAEKLEELSVKEESKESEKKETKEKNEEKQ